MGERVLKIDETLRRRFWSKVDTGPHPKGCWVWTGSKQPAGYGQMSARAISHYPEKAHRIAYWIANGPNSIPEGYVVRHRCDNPPCVRPSHLVSGTPADNARDMVERGRENPWQRNATHCKRNHLLPTSPNAIDGHGNPYRCCLECKEITTRAYLDMLASAKTHCKRGHLLDGSVRDSSGRRYCVPCRKENQQAGATTRRDRRTECTRGHPFTEDNTRLTKSGARVCKACGRRRNREHRERKRSCV